MKRRGYWAVGFATTLNIILYAITFGRYLWLEGRVRGGLFRNWGRRYRYRPDKFVRPTSEEELVALVKECKGIRVFGAGHSFNNGVVADQTLISLDKYTGVIWKDLAKKQVCVKGGTRVRDVSRLLFDDGLAFGGLPSHDAQSIAGILSTDVHGTGREWGFVSEWVVSLKIIDGNGNVHQCTRGDELFQAAIGGIGAVGIISEVVIQATDRFNVEQKVEISNLDYVTKNFKHLFDNNEHFSLYLFPFTPSCQINTWNSTTEKRSVLGPLREFVSISLDALASAWFGGFMAVTGLLPKLATFSYSFKKGTNLVMESYKAFNRTIYPLHQELELTVPFEETLDACRKFLDLYEKMYLQEKLPYTLLEVRFTPAGHDFTLVGAGRDRHSTWINLVCNDSGSFEKYYAESEKLMREIGARPHLGKWCESFHRADLKKVHQSHFERFVALMKERDPEDKFASSFTRRVFREG